MADVHHYDHSSPDSTMMAVVVFLIAVLAVAAIAFFAFNRGFGTGGEVQGELDDDDINIEGTLDLPDSTPATENY